MEMAKRAFISFDYDNDEDLRMLLVGQSRNSGTPFEIADWSVKEHIPTDWKTVVRDRLRRVDLMIVICGRYTDRAVGVASEVTMAQEEKVPYFLLWGRKDFECKKPTSALHADKIYKWTWENLDSLIRGAR